MSKQRPKQIQTDKKIKIKIKIKKETRNIKNIKNSPKLKKNQIQKLTIRQQLEKDKRDKIFVKRDSNKQSQKNNRILFNNLRLKNLLLLSHRSLKYLIVILVFFLSVLIVIQSKYLDVHSINIQGNKYIDEVQIKKYIVNNGGSGLIFNISPVRLKNSIERSFGFIRSVDITKDLPNTLNIKVQEYEPYAILKSKDSFFLVSIEGVIVDKIDFEMFKNKYPLISIAQDVNYNIKDRFDPNVLALSIKALDLAKNSQSVNNLTLTLYTDGSADANMIFNDGKNWIMTLTNKDLLTQYTILTQVSAFKNYKTLDTRFAGSYIIN